MKKLMTLKGVKVLSKNQQKVTIGKMMNTCGDPDPFACICDKMPAFC